MNQVASAILQISSLPVWGTCIYSIIIYKSLLKELKIAGAFLVFSGVIQLISTYCWYNSINNMPLLHIYVAGGFVCLALFYGRIFKGFLNQNLIKRIIGLFLFAALINVLFFQSFFSYLFGLLDAPSNIYSIPFKVKRQQ